MSPWLSWPAMRGRGTPTQPGIPPTAPPLPCRPRVRTRGRCRCTGRGVGCGDEVQRRALLGGLGAALVRALPARQQEAGGGGVLRAAQVRQHGIEGVGALHRLPRADARQEGGGGGIWPSCRLCCCCCRRLHARLRLHCRCCCCFGRCAGRRSTKAERKVGGCCSRHQGWSGMSDRTCREAAHNSCIAAFPLPHLAPAPAPGPESLPAGRK